MLFDMLNQLAFTRRDRLAQQQDIAAGIVSDTPAIPVRAFSATVPRQAFQREANRRRSAAGHCKQLTHDSLIRPLPNSFEPTG